MQQNRPDIPKLTNGLIQHYNSGRVHQYTIGYTFLGKEAVLKCVCSFANLGVRRVYPYLEGAVVAQWVKSWPTDLAIPVRIQGPLTVKSSQP